MDIGEEQETYRLEPLESPIPAELDEPGDSDDEPAEEREPIPAHIPEREREHV
jgi:hypothetical protein